MRMLSLTYSQLLRYNPISEQDFFEEVYPLFYAPDAAPPSDDPLLSHKLSLMFMVLAIGSLVDMENQAYNIEAEKYHQLARASIFQSTLFEDPTISAIQTLASTRCIAANRVLIFNFIVPDDLLSFLI